MAHRPNMAATMCQFTTGDHSRNGFCKVFANSFKFIKNKEL